MRWVLSAVLGFVAVANAEAGKKVTWTFTVESTPAPQAFVFAAPVQSVESTTTTFTTTTTSTCTGPNCPQQQFAPQNDSRGPLRRLFSR